MILYRPVGLQELALIYDSGMKAFPARLPQQPIFYPVLQLAYARQTATNWNAQNGQLAGYVTQFKMEQPYVDQFEEHMVGGSQHQELWIPAEAMEEFNTHIVGHIKVLEAHFGDAFEGFIPDQFALQGKNAVEQFTLLANSYLYKRMDFYLELKRNHKAVYLNYPFWQQYEFKNPGLKEKILQAIKEAWLTSFPTIPLPLPPAAASLEESSDSVEEKEADPFSWEDEEDEEDDIPSVEASDPPASRKPQQEAPPPAKQSYSLSLIKSLRAGIPPNEPEEVDPPMDPVEEEPEPIEPNQPRFVVKPAQASPDFRPRPMQPPSHVSQGVSLGLSGQYPEAIEELTRAVNANPGHVVARTSLGVAFHRSGDEERALASYEAALKIDPHYAEAHYFRANILYSQGNVREAVEAYTRAIGLKPELTNAHAGPAPQDRLTDYTRPPAELYRSARVAQRILDLNKALATNPRQAELLKERAGEYSRLGNYQQAIVDYGAALALQPADARAYHLRGAAHEELGHSDRALEDYQQAMRADPQISDEFIQRGVDLGRMGNFRQAIASLTEGIRLAPRNPDGYFNRGTALFQQGDLESAIADFSRVIELSPRDDAAYYWRGISLEEAGRPEEASADYRHFLEVSQDEQAREEIEARLSQWQEGSQEGPGIARELLGKLRGWVRRRSAAPDDRQKTDEAPAEQQEPGIDLYGLIAALGDRALQSIWLANGLECYGESAEELQALTDQNQPVEGGELLAITAGIRQTVAGDFHAFDPGASAHWLFLRAWQGSGFYIEIHDPRGREQLKKYFPWVEDVEGASPPYASLFLRT